MSILARIIVGIIAGWPARIVVPGDATPLRPSDEE